MAEQLQDAFDQVADLPTTDVEPQTKESQESQKEGLEVCSIPIHILSATQKYFLETFPEPGKIISIALVAEDAPTIIDPADIESLTEPVAIPQHVLVPLQEYFVNRRSNPEEYPKYFGIRFSLEDARLYANAPSSCPLGCTHGLSIPAIPEQKAEAISCESQPQGSDTGAENESRQQYEGDPALMFESAISALQYGGGDDEWL